MQRFLLKHIVSEHLFYFFESVTHVSLHYMLITNRDDAFRKLLESSLNAILAAESEEKLKAKSHERTEQRTDYRNGTRERTLETRIGSIVLKVPRHRNYPFHTMIYELYQRNEAALITTMAEMVVAGVSTRKVSNVIETLCGATPSKSSVSNACKKLDEEVKKFKNRKLESEYPFVIADATYFKVRINRSVVSQALLIAIGINEHGQREIIGFDSYKNESKESWSDFF